MGVSYCRCTQAQVSRQSMRMCKAIRREHHSTLTLDELKTMLSSAKVFSKLDLNHGYNQLELDEESRYITTLSVKKVGHSMQTSASITSTHLTFLAMFLVKMASTQVKQKLKTILNLPTPTNASEVRSSGYDELLWCSFHPQLCHTDS